jgi:hypothetical protein
MQEDLPQDAKSFRLLTMAEFNRLTTYEKAAYVRRAIGELGVRKRIKPEPGSPPSRPPGAPTS